MHHQLQSGDNRSVMGYDNARGCDHNHTFGRVETIEVVCFEDIEATFERNWIALKRSDEQPQDHPGRRTRIHCARTARPRALDCGERLPPERMLCLEDSDEMVLAGHGRMRKLRAAVSHLRPLAGVS